MSRGRPWVALLFLCVLLDFVDPAIPGVFFFETDRLFVDGVVSQTKVPGPTAVADTPARRAMRQDPPAEPRLAERITGVRGGSIAHALRLHARYTYPPPSSESQSEDH